MIDLRLLRTDPERVRASQRARGEDPALVDALLSADEARRAAVSRFDTLRNEQKLLGKQIPKAAGRGEGRAPGAGQEARRRRQGGRGRAERGRRRRSSGCSCRCRTWSSTACPRAARTTSSCCETVGTPRDFAAEGFEPRDHVELGRLLGAIDLERGAKVGGARQYYLTGVGALLELALLNMAMAQATQVRLHPDDHPVAGQARGDGGHRLPRPGRRERLPPRRGRPLPGRHLRGAAGGVPHGRDPGRRPSCRCATPATRSCYRREAGTLRQGHPRHHPGAPVREGRDVLLRPPPRRPRPSTCACWAGRRSSSPRWRCPSG